MCGHGVGNFNGGFNGVCGCGCNSNFGSVGYPYGGFGPSPLWGYNNYFYWGGRCCKRKRRHCC